MAFGTGAHRISLESVTRFGKEAVKKGAILAPLAPGGPLLFRMSLSLLLGDVVQNGPKRSRRPLLGAAKRTLDGEDRSARLEEERNC